MSALTASPLYPRAQGILKLAHYSLFCPIKPSAEKIDALLGKWLRRLPHPYSPADRKAGYRYDL